MPIELVDFDDIPRGKVIDMFVEVKTVANNRGMIQLAAVMYFFCLGVMFPQGLAIGGIVDIRMKSLILIRASHHEFTFCVAKVSHVLALA